MDSTTKDWLIVGCAIVSMCASLSVPITMYYAGKLHRVTNPVRLARKETYTILLGLAAQTRDRFQSALIRQKLQRTRPDSEEIAVQVDEDLGAAWAALEGLGQTLQAEQLICSDKVITLISDARTNHFYNAESLFRVYGHAALDIDALHKHAQDLTEKLKRRCRRELGLNV
ncbi:MAG TPA: hypothetical protein VHO91_07050 [Rhodopila sp.]|nr:hypothetical protein [Rhodopila sp.]